ncbi:MAG: NHLP bacteriocin system secretion protein [Cyanobacteria bacterium SBLK]|nr:NHLP bacteriocin system secretion protein [Cyanobacteria bacterium SBLK]
MTDTPPHPDPPETSKILQPSDIFRQNALNARFGQEKLDRPMHLVRPRDWLTLSGLGTFAILGILWGIFGKIPVTVTGRGVLMRPGQIVEFQAPIAGQVRSIAVRNGQCVEENEVLLAIAPFATPSEERPIRALKAGCIVEMKTAIGQQVRTGTSLGTIERTDGTEAAIALTYLDLANGNRVKPGMSVQITPETISREQFGGIVGTVVSVSKFPISREGASIAIGNAAIAQNIIGQAGGKIEVAIELQRDPTTATGYRWSSSSGPTKEISTGTLTTARIVLEERSPFSFLLSQ